MNALKTYKYLYFTILSLLIISVFSELALRSHMNKIHSHEKAGIDMPHTTQEEVIDIGKYLRHMNLVILLTLFLMSILNLFINSGVNKFISLTIILLALVFFGMLLWMLVLLSRFRMF